MAKDNETRSATGHRTPSQRRAATKGYDAQPEVRKDRAERNAARAKLMKEGKVHKGDGLDVDHKKPLRSGGSNAKGNLRAIPKGKNRGWRDGV